MRYVKSKLEFINELATLKVDSENNKKILNSIFKYINSKFKGDIDKHFFVEAYLEEDDEDESYNYYYYHLDFKIDYKTSLFNSMNNKQRIDDFIMTFDMQKKMILTLKNIIEEDLKISNNQYTIKKSGDQIEINIEVFSDYFEENKSLLSSILGINKFNI